jgi:hypothetical protein
LQTSSISQAGYIWVVGENGCVLYRLANRCVG